MPDEGEYRWALSLGVFRSEEAAQARLAALRAQGVRSARVGARETVVPRIWLQVKGVDAPLQARLKEMARQVEGTELRTVPTSSLTDRQRPARDVLRHDLRAACRRAPAW